jgi:hypothetical protein
MKKKKLDCNNNKKEVLFFLIELLFARTKKTNGGKHGNFSVCKKTKDMVFVL